MLHGYRILDDWDAFVSVDELYEVQSIILMDDFVCTPYFGWFLAPPHCAVKTNQCQ